VDIFVPNSAGLQNVEAFVRRLDTSDLTNLRVSFHDRWVAVHPVVLAAVASAGALMSQNGGRVSVDVPKIATLPYLVVMRSSIGSG
jgi:hypothetical protein